MLKVDDVVWKWTMLRAWQPSRINRRPLYILHSTPQPSSTLMSPRRLYPYLRRQKWVCNIPYVGWSWKGQSKWSGVKADYVYWIFKMNTNCTIIRMIYCICFSTYEILPLFKSFPVKEIYAQITIFWRVEKVINSNVKRTLIDFE